MKNILFVHIPKTAGTSLWTAMVQGYGRDVLRMPTGSTDRLSDAEAAEMNAYDVVVGHICRDDIEKYFAGRQLLTILRHPLDREVSSYFFHRTHGLANTASAMSIEEYFERTVNEDGQPEIWNRQVRQLGGNIHDASIDLGQVLERAKELIDRCIWIGIHDQLETDYQRLRQLPEFDRLPDLPKARVTEMRPRCAELPQKLRERILELNKWDVELYEWALRRRDAMAASSAPAAQPDAAAQAVPAAPAITPQMLIERGMKLDLRGDQAGARALLLTAIESDPRLVWHHRRLLQEVFTRAGGHAELIDILDRSLAAFPQLNYAVDPFNLAAFEQMVQAREKAIYNDKSGMLIASMARTARASINHELMSGMGMMPGVVTPRFAPRDYPVPSWVRDFGRGGLVAVTRLDGRPETLAVLRENGIRKVVVHVRDPREVVISSLHHHVMEPAELPDLLAELGLNWQTNLDYTQPLAAQFEAYAGLGVLPNGPLHWLSTWLEAENRGGDGIEILFTRFEDFLDDRAQLYRTILEFFGIEPRRFHFDYVGTSTPSTPVKSPHWSEVLSAEQVERFNALIPSSWFKRFGWPRQTSGAPALLERVRRLIRPASASGH